MKKTYSAPAIKARKIATESLMLTISGGTGSKIGDPTSSAKPGPESTGRAKAYNVWDDVNVDDEE